MLLVRFFFSITKHGQLLLAEKQTIFIEIFHADDLEIMYHSQSLIF